MLYESSLCGGAIFTLDCHRGIGAILFIKSYRTTSTAALLVLAKIPQIELLKELRLRRKEGMVKIDKKDAKEHRSLGEHVVPTVLTCNVLI